MRALLGLRIVGVGLLSLVASCASQVNREPSAASRQSLSADLYKGAVFYGFDETNRVCRLDILEVSGRGVGGRARVKINFGGPNVATVWVSHPTNFALGAEAGPDASVLRTEDANSPGELKVYLSPTMRPAFAVFYNRRGREGEMVRRICDHLDDSGQGRRRPSSFGSAIPL